MYTVQRVGQEIRRVRTRMGISQKEFGAMIGKSESQVGTYEAGKCSISVDILFKIAEIARICPEELLTGTTKKEEHKKWDAELRIYGLEDRKQVMTILAVNGYDVGQHKKKVTPTGKSVAYYVHATDKEGNADTSK